MQTYSSGSHKHGLGGLKSTAALGPDTWEHLLGSDSFFPPIRGTPTPLAAFQGLLSLWGGGSRAEPRWWLPAWFGFCSRSCAAPSTLAGSAQTHTAGKSPPVSFIPLIQDMK